MALETIVVGVDFSAESDLAVSQALDMARHVGAELVLVHVGTIPGQPGGVPASIRSTLDAYKKILDERLAEDRQQLAELRRRISGQGVEVSHVVTDGYPDTGLAEAAGELGADLIVVGTHGRTGVKRFLLGSVAERVVRLSGTSVLVARPSPLRAATGGFDRVLVATDFSDHAERALELALEVAAPGAHIDLLHCYQMPPLLGAAYAPLKAAEDLYRPLTESIEAEARASGEKLVAKHAREGITLEFMAVEAPPAKGIQEVLESGDYELMVTGSHGRRGVRRFLLGSVSEVTVRHAPCSVLVAHLPAG